MWLDNSNNMYTISCVLCTCTGLLNVMHCVGDKFEIFSHFLGFFVGWICHPDTKVSHVDARSPSGHQICQNGPNLFGHQGSKITRFWSTLWPNNQGSCQPLQVALESDHHHCHYLMLLSYWARPSCPSAKGRNKNHPQKEMQIDSGEGSVCGDLDVPRTQQRSVEIEIWVYVLCGSKGCGLGAVEWSPGVVPRSAKWCEMKVRDDTIVWSELEVWNKAKVQDGARWYDETKRT